VLHNVFKQLISRYPVRAVVLKPWPARPSGVTREAIFIGKKT